MPDPLGGRIAPTAASYDKQGRRRVNPLTPVVHALRVVPVAIIVSASLFSNGALHGSIGWAGAILGGTLLLALVVGGIGWIGWRRLGYWFDDDGDLRVDSGVLVRKERRLQLSRLQSVDVVAPLLARVVGLAELRVEVAGSGDSRAVLQYLTRDEAEALRNEIVARAAGVRHDAGEAPEQVLVTVPPGDLFLSLVLRGSTAVILLVTAALVAVTLLTAGPVGLVFVLFGGAPIFSIVTEFTRYYGFTVARSADGLRLRRGLLQTQHQTVPPGRVHAVGLTQSWLWRKRDWVRVQVDVAGMPGSGDSGDSVLLPVAPRPVARALLADVLPGVDLDAVRLEPAPVRSRRRAWIQWGQLAVGADDRVVVTRRGRITRRWAAVLHARTQSVRVTQGPWQRALRLATVHVDTVPGPVRAVALHRDVEDAYALALAQAERAAQARRADLPSRWLSPPPDAPGGR